MFCRNDKDGRWVNGTTGTIARLSDDEIFVRLDSGRKCAVEPATWENVDYTYDIETHKLEKEVIGTYTQYPLKLAWAITIHKSQGMTFDRLKIDRSFIPIDMRGSLIHGLPELLAEISFYRLPQELIDTYLLRLALFKGVPAYVPSVKVQRPGSVAELRYPYRIEPA